MAAASKKREVLPEVAVNDTLFFFALSRPTVKERLRSEFCSAGPLYNVARGRRRRSYPIVLIKRFFRCLWFRNGPNPLLAQTTRLDPSVLSNHNSITEEERPSGGSKKPFSDCFALR
ncbi:hypothetical protein L596_006971 [Steinernema carpocapsae]|uniref:Uncharacterized protein n=1 Tax=Steinernema carpocapsae TaxID=34508 RepID=A0A4U5P7N1_STECR|nr:hypothetical protein L596_006971 [Steinernema carpocapsae]